MMQGRLAREIMLILVVKLLLLAAIYALCFSPSHRIDPAAGMARILFSQVPG